MLKIEFDKKEIIEKTKDIELEDLGLSMRLYNVLKMCGYNSLTDIMLEHPDTFSRLRNFDNDSTQELMTIREFALESSREQIMDVFKKQNKIREDSESELKDDNEDDELTVTDTENSIDNSGIINEVVYQTDGILLEDIKLSGRLYNCLKRGGYNTLSELLDEKPENFFKLRNFGRQSLQELQTIIDFARVSSREEIIKYFGKLSKESIATENEYVNNTIPMATTIEKVLDKRIDFNNLAFNRDEESVEDIEISDLHLSHRAENVLVRNGLFSLRRVAEQPYSTLVNIKGMGKNSLSEIIDVLKERAVVSDEFGYDKEEYDDIVSEIKTFFKPLVGDISVSKEMIDLVLQTKDINGDYNLDLNVYLKIASCNSIKQKIREIVLRSIPDKVYDEIEIPTLVSLASGNDTRFDSVVKAILDDMVREDVVLLNMNKISRRKPFLSEWIDSLEGNSKIVIEGRVLGRTLEEIGDEIGVTRERIRQISSKALRRKPYLYEDDYKDFIEKFCFTKAEFSSLLDLSQQQVGYLFLNYNSGSGDIQSFLNDESVPQKYKDRAPNVFKKKIIVSVGKCVELNRESIMIDFLQNLISDKGYHIEELMDLYLDYLQEHDLEKVDSLQFSGVHAFEARIVDAYYTIASKNHIIRYYDTSNVDINSLLESVKILRYNNMEISTLKLFRENPEVMEDYDIRDEYELHNLIRKKSDEIQGVSLCVSRMPLMTIGEAEREKQVEELLVELAPISNVELAAEYEYRYGVKSETALANFFKCIDVYYNNGIFDILQKDLSEKEFYQLKNLLTEDFYLIEEIVDIYRLNFQNSKIDVINSMTLKKLGFKVYSQYVINGKYNSADSFFKELLTNKHVLNVNDIPQNIKTAQLYYSVLSDLRGSLKLIEIQKDIYYREDYFLSKFSVNSIKQLLELGREIVDWIKEEGDYFSIDSIIADLMMEDYPEMINNPYILNSILRGQQNIKSGKIANSYIVTFQENELSLNAIICYIVKGYGDIKTDLLRNKLQEDYGIITDKSRIINICKNSDLLTYDEIFDYVCLKEKWSGYRGEVFLSNTRFSSVIVRNTRLINDSTLMIAKVYWNDKYTSFVDYCGMRNLYYMKDLLKLDFLKFYNEANLMNFSKNNVAEVVDIFVNWVSDLELHEFEENEIEANETNEANYENDNQSLLDLFFK